MANILSLHQRRVFLPSGDDARYAKLYVNATGTNTAVNTFSDEALSVQQSRPVVANAWGVFPPVYVEAGAALRILITDENDVSLPGYPQDDIVPLSADVQGAADVVFSPTEDLPYTDAQSAIEGVASLVTEQNSGFERSLTPWITGGTDNAYTITPDPAIVAYGTYQVFTVRPNRANTGAATLNVNGLGARDLSVINTSGAVRALAAGEIQRGREFMAYFDGTRFYMTVGHGYAAPVQTFLNSTTQAAMQTSLGVAVGTQVQAFDADLTALGNLAKTNGNFIVGNGTTWVAESGATARASLGLGSAATLNANDMGNTSGSNTTATAFFAGDGAVAQPSFRFTGDPNSGMYSVSDGNVGISSNGNLRMQVGSSVTVYGTLNAATFAGSGSGLTSVPAEQLTGTISAPRLPSAERMTTANVAAASAGISPGGIGSYAMLRKISGGDITAGGTASGSSLEYAGAEGDTSGGPPSGSDWRCMGYAKLGGNGMEATTLWLRIS